MNKIITTALALALVVLPIGVFAEESAPVVETPVVTEPIPVVEVPVVPTLPGIEIPATSTPPIVDEPATTTPPVIVEPVVPATPVVQTPILEAAKSGGTRHGSVLGASTQMTDMTSLWAMFYEILKAFTELQGQDK